jgi:RNA-directed DNA polymerase
MLNHRAFPKPGTTKLRPITIPPYADRLVQEAIRMVLEAIYEPHFQRMNVSFGFHSGFGVHNAICKLKNGRLSQGLDKAIEGDIEQAYPSLNRQTLLKVLGWLYGS